VAVAGVSSAAFVVTANAWMNAPAGFTAEDGVVTHVDILAAMFNPAAVSQIVHMVLAAYTSVGFGVAGLHAYLLRQGRGAPVNRKAFKLAATVGTVAVMGQMLSGHQSAVTVFKTQPVKGAAMEALWETQACAPMEIGGISLDSEEKVVGALRIPCALSLLLSMRLDTVVQGLKDFPAEDRPPTMVVHFAFDLMVTLGMALLALGLLWIAANVLRWNWWDRRGFLLGYVLAAPLGFVALESGWVVTEVGRQPWVIQGVMRTANAVTEVPDVWVPLLVFMALYVVMAFTVVLLMRAEVLEQDEPGKGGA
jgi:cytochrome d ubiquinol oxidase subunit I